MSFRATYAGDCADCDEPIEPGNLIETVTGGFPDEHLGYRHTVCPEAAAIIPEPACPKCHLVHAGECF